jgi:general L-amino acid transport system substrate-binding protein
VQQPKPEDHLVLPEIISKEPLGPSVRQGDDQWLTVVKWVHYALLNAEEAGITQANVAEMVNSTNPEIKRIVGKDGELGKGLGLPNDFVVSIVKAVGNYGELFERNVGSGSRLKIARGLNKLWNNGGLQYAPPLR